MSAINLACSHGLCFTKSCTIERRRCSGWHRAVCSKRYSHTPEIRSANMSQRAAAREVGLQGEVVSITAKDPSLRKVGSPQRCTAAHCTHTVQPLQLLVPSPCLGRGCVELPCPVCSSGFGFGLVTRHRRRGTAAALVGAPPAATIYPLRHTTTASHTHHKRKTRTAHGETRASPLRFI